MADDALVRWEQTRREALGTAITLLFGLSSGALAFCGAVLMGEHVQFGGAGTTLFIAAVGAFIFCLVASVFVTITRLESFRTTVEVVRKKESGKDTDELERLRCRTRCFDSCTWFLFYFQLATFFFGAVLLMLALWYLFQQRLFPLSGATPIS
jgi:hypothetical protein